MQIYQPENRISYGYTSVGLHYESHVPMRLFKRFNKENYTDNQIKLDSVEIFSRKIKSYYIAFVGELISDDILSEICDFLSLHFYEEYSRFRIQYPKSIKRYSTLKVSDLENPLIQDKIIKFCKTNYNKKYPEICSTLFKMSIEGLFEYEKQRTEFYKMF